MGIKLRPKGRSADDDESSPQAAASLAFHPEALQKASPSETSLPASQTTLSATFELTAAATTVAAPFHASVVKIIDTTAWPSPSPDPAGLVWKPGVAPGTGTLLVSDSEIDETPFNETNNLFAFKRNGTFEHSESLENFCKEPTGIAYVASTKHLFISDDEKNRIFEVDSRNPGVLLRSFSTKSYAVDCEDIAYDPTTNHLLIVNGDNGGAANLYPHRIFETTTTGQLVRTLTLPTAISDPEAIAYDPVRNVFYVSGAFSPDIFVVSRDGKTILDTITILEGYDNPITNTHVRPKALTLASTSNPNDDPSVMSLWVADYGADQVMDGRIFEVQISNLLFSGKHDVVDFNQVVAGNYYGSQYDALAGNDTVMLAANAAVASKAGFDPTQIFSGGDGDDFISGRALGDRVSGGDGDDFIRGGAGNDSLAGDSNADTLRAGLGNDFLDGGSDNDTVDYQEAVGAVTVNLALGTAIGEGNDTLVNIEHVIGSRLNDSITGNSLANLLIGYVGNDTLHGGSGSDTVMGGSGHDRLAGDGNADTLRGGLGNDFLNGGSDNDTVDYQRALGAVTVNLALGTAIGEGNDTLVNIEHVIGSRLNDSITGNSLANLLIGYVGNDTLHGGSGSDTVMGGSGHDRLAGDGNADTLRGGLGNDFLNGGSDNDTVDYQRALGAVTVNLALGTAIGEGNDTLVNIEHVIGSRLNDSITGNSLANLLIGYVGNDTLHGGSGNDTVIGGAGVDRVFGDAGHDTLTWDIDDSFNGGSGFDTLNADLPDASSIDLRSVRYANLEGIQTGGGDDIVTLSVNDVLSDTADNQFVANLGSGSDTLRIDLSGGWTATAQQAALGLTGVAAGISVAGMTTYTFTNGYDAVTVFTNAEVVNAQIL